MDWVRSFPGAMTVCDAQGLVVEMNDEAARVFEKDGGRGLVGRSLLDCHPEPARSKLKKLLEQRTTNVYTIEKNGQRKLIYQAPIFAGSLFQGLVELALPIPAEIPHLVRQA